MKNILLKIVSALVGLLLLASAPILILGILAILAICYWGIVIMTHHLISNNWIAIPIDICVLGVIYSIMKTSRQTFGDKLNESGGAGIDPEEIEDDLNNDR